MLKITPTVFIGIGSSGLEIINSVRELLYEEFLTPGLPCVRFLNVTSHLNGESFSLPNEQFTNTHEKMKVVEIPISDTLYHQVPLMLDPNNRAHYSAGLAEWFPHSLTRLPAASLLHGMQNNRKLGRLALWLNWNKVTESVTQEIQILQTAQATYNTNTILSNYYTQKGMNLVGAANYVSQGLNIFICGTLLGGTCSGSFLDIAYYIAANHPHAKAYGIFTLLDPQLSSSNNNSRLAANAYAAMREVDYYSQTGTVFDYLLPNTQIRQGNYNGPFYHTSFITTRNMVGTRGPIVGDDGSIDTESMHKMIGLALFFTAVSDTNNELEGMRTNWDKAGGNFLQQVHTTPRYLKSFTSFGASALWYPKSKISGAAATQYIMQNLCTGWLGENGRINHNNITAAVTPVIQNITNQMRTDFSTFHNEMGEQTTISSDWQKIYNQFVATLQNGGDVSQLQSSMLFFPENNPLASRFKINGYYFQKLNANMQIVENNLIEYIEKLINQQIDSSLTTVFVTLQPRFSLSELLQFGQSLIESLSRIAQNNINIDSNDMTFDELSGNMSALQIEQQRLLTLWIGAREDVIAQHTQAIASGMHYLLNKAEENLLNYFISKKLGECINTLRDTISTKLKKVYEEVLKIRSLAQERLVAFRSVKAHPSLKIVFRQNMRMEDEIQSYQNLVHQSVVTAIFPDILASLSSDQPSGKNAFFIILNVLQHHILNMSTMQNFNIFSHINVAEITSYAKNAMPMFEPTTQFLKIPYPVNQYPALIAGGDQNSRKEAITQITANTQIQALEEVAIDLNHLLFFYVEEAGIAIGEFETFRHMEVQYNRGHQYGNHLDQNADRFDIERFLRKKDMMDQNWLRISNEIFENQIFDKQITQGNRTYFEFIYDDSYQNSDSIFYDPANEGEFYNILSSNSEAFTQFAARFSDACNHIDQMNFREKMNEVISKCARIHGPSSDEYKETREFYQKVVKLLYPQNLSGVSS